MVGYAKKSGYVDYIDTTTNGTFLSPERLGPVLDAGIDKINISVDGMTEETYAKFTGFKFDFKTFVANVKWLYANKDACEIVVKIPGELITEAQRQEFFDTFGDHCDRIFVENFAPCWPGFDVEKHTGIKIGKGMQSVYWQFELDNSADASKFELHDMTVLPIILSRKVRQ